MSVYQVVAVAVRLFALWLVMISLQVGAIAAVMNKNLDGGPSVLRCIPDSTTFHPGYLRSVAWCIAVAFSFVCENRWHERTEQK